MLKIFFPMLCSALSFPTKVGSNGDPVGRHSVEQLSAVGGMFGMNLVRMIEFIEIYRHLSDV